MNTITEPVAQPEFMVDSRANLIIEAGKVKLHLAPHDAIELIKFIERTGYQAHANSVTKGAPQ